MPRAPGSASLTILSGLHEGARQVLTSGTTRIGGGSGADLLLADDGMAPVHLELELLGGRANLRALQAGVVLDGAGPLQPDVPAMARLPATFEIAGVRCRCDAPPATFRPTGRLAAFASLGMIGLVLLVASLGTAVRHRAAPLAATRPPRDVTHRPGGPQADASPGAGTQADAAAPPATRPALSPLAAASRLSGTLAASGLSYLQVGVDGDGSVLVSGIVPTASAGQWDSARQSFDRATAGVVALRSTVTVRDDRPFTLPVDSVWTGNMPSIVIGGAKYLEGSVLPNGWTLDHIETGRITLHRGGDKVAVAF